MSLALKYLPKYNYLDYQRWEGDWELIEGIPYSMSPSPFRKHQKTLFKLVRFFEDSLENSACNSCEVLGELDWILNDNTIIRPDLFLSCNAIKNDNDFLRPTPDIVVEILSKSTALKDRNLKYELYESQGVKYYLIVDPISEQIEIYELKNKVYKKQAEFKNENFTFDLEKCNPTVSFKNIWS